MRVIWCKGQRIKKEILVLVQAKYSFLCTILKLTNLPNVSTQSREFSALAVWGKDEGRETKRDRLQENVLKQDLYFYFCCSIVLVLYNHR